MVKGHSAIVAMTVLAAMVLTLVGPAARTDGQTKEIFHPMLVTKTGPFASAASGVSGGQQDYFALINAKGGIDGYKIRWEECEFGYQTPRALECYERYRRDWKIVYPNSTPVIYALAERVTNDRVPAINLAG